MRKNIILNERIDFYRNTLVYLEFIKNDIIYISNRDEDYFEKVIYNSSFFGRTYRNSIKLFVLELYKIISNNEDYSLQRFLNDIINNEYHDSKWHREPDLNIITEYRNVISAISKSKNFEKIKNLRNKHYAHSDIDRNEFETNVPFKKLWSILDEIQQIFNYINLHFKNEQLMFSSAQDRIREINSLQKYKQIKSHVLDELIKCPDLGKLQKIRDIIIK